MKDKELTMPQFNLALIGFGNVGQALAGLLLSKQEELKSRYGLTFKVTGIATGRHGMAINPDGLDLALALNYAQKGISIDRLSSSPSPPETLEFIHRCQASILFENSPVNYETGQPAVDYLKTALELGMHAITANKGPVVHAYRELTVLANRQGRKFYFESTVMDGAPIFSLFREALPGALLTSLRGVLNSTTNLILTRMEEGESFDQAVAYAQSIGIAETDPSGDVDGWDAAVKVAALVTVLMDMPLKPNQVDRQGIREINAASIVQAKEQGKRWKLVCSASMDGDGVQARVRPEMVSPDSPLYGVEGTTSIVQFETDVLGLLSVIEENPGPETTAYGLLADFLNAARK
jgi:homoserine dehydrogenase